MRLQYSIFAIAAVFALALVPSANSMKQTRLGIGDPGAYAALEPGFAKPVANDAVAPDTDGRDDGAANVKFPTTPRVDQLASVSGR
jgi:hypothetical protein